MGQNKIFDKSNFSIELEPVLKMLHNFTLAVLSQSVTEMYSSF